MTQTPRIIFSDFDSDQLAWNKAEGLIPAIVQDVESRRVLMLGYVNRESLQATLTSGLVTFFSRSKQRLWQKGESSGHVLRLKDIRRDCDNDALLLLVAPEGPTCHRGTLSCFTDTARPETPSVALLADLAATVRDRRQHSVPNSYTQKLFAEGLTRIAQKVGEEGVETALAAATQSPTLPAEAADLLYHLLVLLEASNTSLHDVLVVLESRAKKSS